MDVLVVIDMQNDFISGSLKGRDTEKLLDKVVEKVEEFKGEIIYTLDTHYEDYLKTKEGENLPIEHCIKGTWGHEIADELKETKSFDRAKKFEKNTFASIELGDYLKSLDQKIFNVIKLEFINQKNKPCKTYILEKRSEDDGEKSNL